MFKCHLSGDAQEALFVGVLIPRTAGGGSSLRLCRETHFMEQLNVWMRWKMFGCSGKHHLQSTSVCLTVQDLDGEECSNSSEKGEMMEFQLSCCLLILLSHSYRGADDDDVDEGQIKQGLVSDCDLSMHRLHFLHFITWPG